MASSVGDRISKVATLLVFLPLPLGTWACSRSLVINTGTPSHPLTATEQMMPFEEPLPSPTPSH
jgi:hypothetical protein